MSNITEFTITVDKKTGLYTVTDTKGKSASGISPHAAEILYHSLYDRNDYDSYHMDMSQFRDYLVI